MVSKLTVQKATDDGEPLFEVAYHLLKTDGKDEFRTTDYGTEGKMRDRLESLGVTEKEIDKLFSDAKT
jgi:hypothetical protein